MEIKLIQQEAIENHGTGDGCITQGTCQGKNTAGVSVIHIFLEKGFKRDTCQDKGAPHGKKTEDKTNCHGC